MTPRRAQMLRTVAIFAGLLAVWLLLHEWSGEAPSAREVAYSDVVTQLRQGNVREIVLYESRIVATLKTPADGEPARLMAIRLPKVDESALVKEASERGVTVSGRVEESSTWLPAVMGAVFPLLLIMGLFLLLMRRVASTREAGALSFGRTRAKIYDESRSDQVTFADVAGVDEAVDELREVVDFLRHPEKYQALGARIPKGVLLLGAPGTGKTLLARAVAGEAGVPFFTISGSDFVEMFVGVGAARVRDLFEQAKSRAPCIVFIDEVDAVGRSRGGVTSLATHDEREQTLNQLLAEMDGFDPKSGVVIMAATNRPEILDPALVRSGRFDRQVVVDSPDVQGRLGILKVHARKVKLGSAVDLHVIARRTPGMVGADLAKVVNEAALSAARRGSHEVVGADFEEAIDRIQLGLKKRGRAMSEDEKRRIAYHEAGHALVASSVEHADPVHRVTIIPRTIGALGATLQLPTEDRYVMTREELKDRLAVMLAGRAAEELMCDDISTGAQNDLERATETARQMVTRFGMSDKLGAQTFGRALSLQFLQLPGLGEERTYSEATAEALDLEVSSLLKHEWSRAREILATRRALLEKISALLLERETIEGAELSALIAEARPVEPVAIAGGRA